VASSSITSRASRLHGRDDHAPFFRTAAKSKNAHTLIPQIAPSKKFILSLHLGFFTGLKTAALRNLDVFEHGITSDTIGKTGKNPRTRCW
jgi:hypothetical protein